MDPLSIGIGAGAGLLGSWGVSRFREHQKKRKGLADLLGWGFMVDDGTVLQKDGSFLSAWRYRGPDLNSATAAELDTLSAHVNRALLPYADGWMFHFDAVRGPAIRYAPEGHFSDPVSRLIDEERRRSYTGESNHYETECYLSVTYLPPPTARRRFEKYILSGKDGNEVDWNRVLAQYRSALDDMEQRLSARLRMERLSSGQLTTHLHRCVTGLEHEVNVRHGSYLNNVLASQRLIGGFEPVIGGRYKGDQIVGGKHIRPVAVQGFPEKSYAGMTHFINELGCSYRWSTRFVPLSRQSAKKQIKRRRQRWHRKRKGASDLIADIMGGGDSGSGSSKGDDDVFLDQDAVGMRNETGQALADSTSGEARFGYYTSTILVMEETSERADRVASLVTKKLRDNGLTARVEGVNAVEAYIGSLPGHGQQNLRRPLLSSKNLVDLLPLTAPWPGEDTNPSNFFPEGAPPLMWAKTAGTTPFRVNLHAGDVGHTLVVGATGAGKSVLVGLQAAQWLRYENAKVFLFDVGKSHLLMSKAVSGQHYDVGSAEGPDVQFQPLRYIDDPDERTWAVGWLEILFEMQGETLSSRQRERLTKAVELTAQNEPHDRTLTALMINLGDEAFRSALRPYTVEGSYGHLLDGERDTIEEGGHQVFEMQRIIDMPDKVLVPTLFYLFHRVEEQLTGDPALIVIEEAWAALMHSDFADRIRQWLLTLRKQNAAVVLVAHSPAQFKGEDIKNAEMIVESCQTRIFLPNADAASPDTKRLYRQFGLNDTEIEMIAKGRKKQDYYFSSPDGSRLFQLGLGPVALSFLGTLEGRSATETIQEAQRLEREHGPEWPREWLRLNGLDEWINEYDAFARSLTSASQDDETPTPDDHRRQHESSAGDALQAA